MKYRVVINSYGNHVVQCKFIIWTTFIWSWRKFGWGYCYGGSIEVAIDEFNRWKYPKKKEHKIVVEWDGKYENK